MIMKNCRISSIGCLGDKMERINEICRHPVWKEQMAQLEQLEKDRIFCKHGTEHLLDVARLAYIENLEENRGIEKECIYAAALLHDVGKALQYTQKIPHEKGGREYASVILKDCGFDSQEEKVILEAIAGHRDSSNKECKNLTGIIYRADKRSRMCGFCKAYGACNWSEEKKNYNIFL